jgi:hypothetical protein
MSDIESKLAQQAVSIVNVLERRPYDVMHFLLQRLQEAPTDEDRLELMRLVDAEVVRRNPYLRIQ